jgi:hypothetical protein
MHRTLLKKRFTILLFLQHGFRRFCYLFFNFDSGLLANSGWFDSWFQRLYVKFVLLLSVSGCNTTNVKFIIGFVCTFKKSFKVFGFEFFRGVYQLVIATVLFLVRISLTLLLCFKSFFLLNSHTLLSLYSTFLELHCFLFL